MGKEKGKGVHELGNTINDFLMARRGGAVSMKVNQFGTTEP